MNKCFEAIQSFEFQDHLITGFISPENESIIVKPIDVDEGERKGNVELWLTEVEKQIKASLTKLT